MEITIKDIIKTIINKWYILAVTISILIAMGSVIGLNNYRKSTYSASSSFLFSYSSSNVSLHVSNCKQYLLQDYVTYSIKDKMELSYGNGIGYEISIEIISAILTIKVDSTNAELSKAVIREYSNVILSNENQTVTTVQDLTVTPLFSEPYVREYPKSLTSLFTQIALFAFIGVFIGGIIILTPFYNNLSKLEKERIKKEAAVNNI